ncbi:MAG: 16S rRNA (guanine(527)-N(7))-methyltransferase RsmG [Tenericutes bacterium]|nr:16S rRNA (guanine(527)-N(7))-methyltransferase RsmG [Mycoplasmatota bacterium]
MKHIDINQHLLELLNKQEFLTYYEYLIEQNKLINLTTITEKEDVYLKHFYDSLVISTQLDFNHKKVLDIGAGAGFPSIPIHLINESLGLTIVDGLNKRIKFLENLTQKLDLKVSLIHGRAENLDLFKHFDIILARAVAKLNILLEMALPLLKINGYFVAYKSVHYQEELNVAKNAINVLGGKVEEIIEYTLTDELKHVYIIIKKVKDTPHIYPRHFSKIKKSPL